MKLTRTSTSDEHRDIVQAGNSSETGSVCSDAIREYLTSSQ